MLNMIMGTTKTTGLCWLWLSLLAIILDQSSKYLASYYLPILRSVKMLPFFNLQLTTNKGAAFSLFAHAGDWQNTLLAIISLLVSFAVLGLLYKTAKTEKLTAIGLVLILGGAIGNLIDRIFFGYVRDFLDFHIQNWHYPIFNLADSAIVIGAILWMIALFVHHKVNL